MHELSEIMILLFALGAIVWQAHGRIASQRALQQLARREQLQHQLVRETSWALRNTLTIARGHIELIHNADVGGSVHADTVVALEELDRIGSLTNDLLIDTEHEPFEIVF